MARFEEEINNLKEKEAEHKDTIKNLEERLKEKENEVYKITTDV